MTSLLDLRLLIIACLTLGLAPFLPEPHIWGKIKWLIGGGKGMGLIDYVDLILHGTPWILLIYRLLFPSDSRYEYPGLKRQESSEEK